MCKVYNTIGSLTTIKTRLTQNKIDDFNSLGELLSFRDNYANARRQIISNHEILVTEERNSLSAEVLRLEDEISTGKVEIQQKLKRELEILRQNLDELLGRERNLIQEFTYSFKIVFVLLKIKYREVFFNSLVSSAVSSAIGSKAQLLTQKKDRLQYIAANFDQAVKERSWPSLLELDRKKGVIDEMNTFIYGALGEQKVVKELEKLSDDYILINDFSMSFTQPIYNPQAKQYIKSVQIDHLLISASGIFLIETKNWSKDSLNDWTMRSPVGQIRRASFALDTILSNNPELTLAWHHWGERKIPIRNLIVMINHKPTVEFEHVKIVTLRELLGYVEFFEPSLSSQETQKIADYLINLVQRIKKVNVIAKG